MSEKEILTHSDIDAASWLLAKRIVSALGIIPNPICIYGVPRGGVPVAYNVRACLLTMTGAGVVVTDSADEAHILVDDLYDSGNTMKRYQDKYPDKPFFALFQKPDRWLVFPWEQAQKGQVDTSATDIPIRLLQYIGEDPSRGGLADTPSRFLKAWDFYSSGYRVTDEELTELLRSFEDGAELCDDELVLVKDIPVYSHCEHHLAPFFGTVSIGYIPNGKVLGLSKFKRLVEVFARRLQVQERLTNQIADAINDHLKPIGVGVVMKCRHMCMESRGVQTIGSHTSTSALRGVIKDQVRARGEFFTLIEGKGRV